MPIRIVLADDHVIVRQGLKFILEEEGFQVVGEASNGREIVRLAEKLVPEVAVLDGRMPLLNGVDATKEIVKVSPRTKIILLTMHSEKHFVTNALRAGARGYLLKERAAEELVQAVTEVTRGGIYLSPSISRTVLQARGRMRIVLADDRVIVRQGLKFILEKEGFQVVGEASNGQEAMNLSEKLVPEVAVLDVGMSLLNGVDATKEIIKVSPRTKIILLTMHSEKHFVTNALRAGARGYVLKERAAEELVQAVTEVTRGGIYLSPSISPPVSFWLQLAAAGKTYKA
jgi:DNA-binding NarL/FixJ family response regulator